MIDKIYHAFLWFWGFAEGEHITDMLRRQKARFGGWWWPIILIPVISGNCFIVWLILHVLGIC